jgi:hypothetical protein
MIMMMTAAVVVVVDCWTPFWDPVLFLPFITAPLSVGLSFPQSNPCRPLAGIIYIALYRVLAISFL